MAEVRAIADNESLRSFWQFKGADSYIDNLFLMGSPLPVLLIWVSYMFFVFKCGPKFMENRPAYKLRNLLLIYNASQVALALYLVFKGIEGLFEFGLLEREHNCLTEIPDKIKFRLFTGHHIYLLSKVAELMDTVFFVLRKKWSQVSFLHVYHHSIMCLANWLILKYEPTYSLTFLGTMNSLVHVIMYTYYGLSAFPGLAKYLWWKKYITKMQLVQFAIGFVHTIWNWSITTCPVSYILLSATGGHLLLFIYLFTDFYFNRYNTNVEASNENKFKKQQ